MSTSITPIEITARRIALGLSREGLGSMLGVSFDSIKSWEQGRRGIPAGVRDDLERLEAKQDAEVDSAIESGRCPLPEKGTMLYEYAMTVIGLAMRERPDLVVEDDFDPMDLFEN